MKYLSCTFVVVDEGTEVVTDHVDGVAFRVDGLDGVDLEALRNRLTFMFRREASQEIEARLAAKEPRGEVPPVEYPDQLSFFNP